MKWLNHTTCQYCTLKTNFKKNKQKKQYHKYKMSTIKQKNCQLMDKKVCLKKTALKKMFALQFCDLKCPFHQVNSTI